MTKVRDSFRDLPTTSIPTKFVRHWQNEAMRLEDLCEVLFRSLTARAELSGRGEPKGDETLAKHIQQSLNFLWVEIEQVALDGRWEPRSWEVLDE